MKTFKLKALDILNQSGEEVKTQNIPLLDGLIINREDEKNQWTIEAYVSGEYTSFFEALEEKHEEVMLQVKITKESNEPATFITKITGINKINENSSILFLGNIIDRRKNIIEEMLARLMDEGYQGKELLNKFKEQS